MAGAVFLPAGSPITWAFGTSGAIDFAVFTRSREVRIHTSRGSTSPRSRSSVSASMGRSPRRERNCFGRERRESGQNRSPRPPARMTA